MHLFSGPVEAEAFSRAHDTAPAGTADERGSLADRVAALEAEVAELRRELAALRGAG
jgi:uncharacterized protein YceH (UPF0502 family)